MIPRKLEKIILERIGKKKIILILGARQTGKTTLVKQIADQLNLKTLWLNGDEPDVREMLSNVTSTRLKTLIGAHQLVIVDEAQRIENIGLTLKLMVDNIPDIQIIATGSSSLELANRIREPLTGRKYEFYLYPISYREMVEYRGELEENRLLEHRLIYGYYPEVVTHPGEEVELLSLLSSSYLYKDLFTLEGIKKPAVLEKLVRALALQIGNEVSYHEIGQLIGADKQTVERYIDLLEKAFIVFRLQSLSGNLRNEIKKSRKIYFYDNGIRNAVIKNFNSLSFRQDVGALWENFLISERTKRNHYMLLPVNQYFWRTHAQQEIDYIEEYNGKFYAYEFKWNPAKKVRFPQTFLKAYPDAETIAIHPENFMEFL
ncbi:MAG: ATP-binding protein [Calditrichaeota bacterium]|nr:MAG: ATP-binding protein [Calditrichota bacterium]